MSKRIPITQVDAFTDRPFAGNPAAVVRLERPADAGWMQAVAREMNLSETGFVVPRAEPGAYDLRWFTPAVEVDLCGHATLAAAHVLWDEGGAGRGAPLRFETRSGTLSARFQGGWIALDFPSLPPAPDPGPADLAAALGPGAAIRDVARSRFDLLVEIAGDGTGDGLTPLRDITPDLRRVAAWPYRGVIVTAEAGGGARRGIDFVTPHAIDFVSRFFAPAAGVDEDPVTGSAHCVLAPYWAGRLGREEMTGYQASARGGIVKVSMAGDRVTLAGQAVTVFRGTLLA